MVHAGLCGLCVTSFEWTKVGTERARVLNDTEERELHSFPIHATRGGGQHWQIDQTIFIIMQLGSSDRDATIRR